MALESAVANALDTCGVDTADTTGKQPDLACSIQRQS
jgi:hypothetical protein